jgi:hypothetical protein
MGVGLLAVKSGFILFIKNYQFPLQINTLEREREREDEVLGFFSIGNLVINNFKRERERGGGWYVLCNPV